MVPGVALFDSVSAQVQRFEHLVKGDMEPADLHQFLPQAPSGLRSLTLIELAKLHMRRRTALHLPIATSDYVHAFAELGQCTGGAPLDLIVEEIRLKKLSKDFDPGPILKQFPIHRSGLERFLKVGETTIAKSVSANFASRLSVGDQIEGFQLIKVLGRGSFANVFLCRQASMQRMVALKVSENRGDEAKMLAKLDHPHIVRVYDVRTLPDQSAMLLSMQYAPGGTLQDVINLATGKEWSELSGGTLLASIDRHLLAAEIPFPEESERRRRIAKLSWLDLVIELGIQLASALDYAHSSGVLHRDIKPANILLTAEGICKLADFNVSFAEEVCAGDASSYFGGSLLYMSPEQLQATHPTSPMNADKLDERSDVFSLSTVLWELLVLRTPWPTDQLLNDWQTTIETMRQHRILDQPQLPTLPRTSLQFERVVNVLKQGLDANSDTRIGSAALLGGQLRLCGSPRAWQLMHPESKAWRAFICQRPMLTSAVAIFLPNALAGWFNYAYNQTWLINKHPEVNDIFIRTSTLINFVSFSIGALLFVIIAWPISKDVAQRFRRRSQTTSKYLERACSVGSKAAGLSMLLWGSAGIGFPVLLALQMDNFGYSDAVHFLISLAVCGAIACTYPFLLMTLISIECWYGLLVGDQFKDATFEGRSRRLLRRCDWILLLAISVPLVALVLLLVQEAPVRPALFALVGASGIGVVAAFRVFRRLHNSIETIRHTVLAKDTTETSDTAARSVL